MDQRCHRDRQELSFDLPDVTSARDEAGFVGLVGLRRVCIGHLTDFAGFHHVLWFLGLSWTASEPSTACELNHRGGIATGRVGSFRNLENMHRGTTDIASHFITMHRSPIRPEFWGHGCVNSRLLPGRRRGLCWTVSLLQLFGRDLALSSKKAASSCSSSSSS